MNDFTVKNYFIIGEHKTTGERILYQGSFCDCIHWIWNNCDVGDLTRKGHNRWSGKAYYDTNNEIYEIEVDKFYR